MTTEICSVSNTKVNTPLGIVVKALLEKRGMRQGVLADKLEMTDSNLSQRLRAGTMSQESIIRINNLFNVNLLHLINRFESGIPIEEVLATKSTDQFVNVELELTPEEVKEVMLNQQKSKEELNAKFNELVGQIKTWIDHDQERMRKQEEIINMLMEERAEYKSKKK